MSKDEFGYNVANRLNAAYDELAGVLWELTRIPFTAEQTGDLIPEDLDIWLAQLNDIRAQFARASNLSRRKEADGE